MIEIVRLILEATSLKRYDPRNFVVKHCQRLAIGLALVLAPVGYLISYPLAYRSLVGSDASRTESVPFTIACCLCEGPTEAEFARWRAWARLEQCYFPPAEWLLDHTPLRYPMLSVARLVDADEQLQGEICSRDLRRTAEEAKRTGGEEAAIQMQLHLISKWQNSQEATPKEMVPIE